MKDLIIILIVIILIVMCINLYSQDKQSKITRRSIKEGNVYIFIDPQDRRKTYNFTITRINHDGTYNSTRHYLYIDHPYEGKDISGRLDVLVNAIMLGWASFITRKKYYK